MAISFFRAKLNDLASFELYISRVLVLLSITCLLLAFAVFLSTLYVLKSKEDDTSIELISNANRLLQSNLSEQISIIANNQDFINYLKSGPVSRQENYSEIAWLMTNLDPKLVIGIAVKSNDGSNLFSYGEASDFFVNFGLCYMGDRLNSTFGICRHSMTVYMDKSEYAAYINRINKNISICGDRKCIYLIPFADKKFGSFPIFHTSEASIQLGYKQPRQYEFVFFFVFFVALMLILLLVSMRFVRNIIRLYLVDPIASMQESLRSGKKLTKDTRYLLELSYLLKTITQYQNEQISIELGKTIAQVAHDIRSPLIAMQTFVESSADKLDEQDRLFLRNTFQRIDEIAQNLVARYKGNVIESQEKNQLLLVAIAIFEILNEKRVEYKNRQITFETDIDGQAYFALIQAHKTEFRRILSNLINNAANAMPDGGMIKVSLASDGVYWNIVIQDQGVGISHERIQDLLATEPSAQAKIGLGLSHAKAQLTALKGRLNIQSREGEGTCVQIQLPKAVSPAWLCQSLPLSRQGYIAVVDDDQTIHDTWNTKLVTQLQLPADRIFHFKIPQAFIAWRLSESISPLTILCDYEFMNATENGLDVLSQVNAAQKILVTSHYNEEPIIQRCLELGVKLLPKHLVPFMVMSLEENKPAPITNDQPYDLVFIDNEPYNIDMWERFAKVKKVKLKTYASTEAFWQEKDRFPLATPIYIDQDFGESQEMGVAFSRRLYEAGFTELYIATGYMLPSDEYTWLKGIVSKKPPFV